MSIRKNTRRILATAGLPAGILAASDVVWAQIPRGGYEVTMIIQAPEWPPISLPAAALAVRRRL